MGTPFVGEIRMVGFNFAPVGWAFCDGSLIPISENDTLFNLIGTTYGGDGQQTFALPDLRSRIPLHAGTGPGLSTRILSEVGGVETVTLIANQIPSHSHAPQAQSGGGNQSSPSNGIWANSGQGQYSTDTPTLALKATLVGQTGGSQPHDNMMPYTVINFIISLFGVYPSQS
jgi:microcystin-dependent protein